MAFSIDNEPSDTQHYSTPALNALSRLANLARLQQLADATGDSDLRWQCREEIPAALDEAERLLKEDEALG